MNRIEREKATVGMMIGIYCRRHHVPAAGRELCSECEQLLAYACERLDRCPKSDRKSSCRKCEIHCYMPERREAIRRVMRYVGPRMLFIAPCAALRHLLAEHRAPCASASAPCAPTSASSSRPDPCQQSVAEPNE